MPWCLCPGPKDRRSETYNHRAVNDVEDAIEALSAFLIPYLDLSLSPARGPGGCWKSRVLLVLDEDGCGRSSFPRACFRLEQQRSSRLEPLKALLFVFSLFGSLSAKDSSNSGFSSLRGSAI